MTARRVARCISLPSPPVPAAVATLLLLLLMALVPSPVRGACDDPAYLHGPPAEVTPVVRAALSPRLVEGAQGMAATPHPREQPPEKRPAAGTSVAEIHLLPDVPQPDHTPPPLLKRFTKSFQ